MKYHFIVKAEAVIDRDNLMKEIKDCPECANVYNYTVDVIRVDIKNNISQAEAESFRKKILNIVTTKYSGNEKDVSTIAEIKNRKIKRISPKSKKILMRATLFGSVIFLIVLTSLVGVVNPIITIPPDKIVEASVLPALIAFVTELYSSYKGN